MMLSFSSVCHFDYRVFRHAVIAADCFLWRNLLWEERFLDMPTTLESPVVTTLTDFTKQIEERLAAANGGPLWHRGNPDFAHDLLSPSLYRHPTIKDTKKLLEVEMKMLSRFQQRSIPFVNQRLQDHWERLFFMQHSAIPTRLLDWTENPFIALYFALTSKSKTADEDSAVWILDPIKWNQKSLDRITYKGGIISVDDPEGLLKGFKPGEDYDNMSDKPLAIHGYHNTARIVAQRGEFMIFGKENSDMEKLYREDNYPQDCLVKLRLRKDEKANLLKSLFQIGFTHSVIFPDLEGFAKEMKHTFGFTD
jgi:hypothetical protein